MLRNRSIDFLMIHVGRKEGLKKSLSLAPLGLLGLADFLNKQNVCTRVLNIPFMRLENKKFDLFQVIDKYNIPLVGITLHWYPQLYECLTLAQKIKNRHPQTRIVLGGFTATCFSQEIMKDFCGIDFIVRGDPEIPMVELVKCIRQNDSDLSRVPNLTWRKKGTIVVNPQSYAATAKVLDQISFFNMENLINDQGKFLRNPHVDTKKNGKQLYYNIGRGCSTNCSFCGGSACAQALLNRRKVIIKSIPSILQDLRLAKKLGIDCIATSFDPYPGSKMYIDLFKEMRRSKLRFDLFFEAWGLPSDKLVESMAATFRRAEIAVSPFSGSEKIRRLNKGFFFTNQAFIGTIARCKSNNISFQVHFSIGLPFETEQDISETMALIEMLKNYHNVNVCVGPLILDPASPMYLHPQKYKINLHRKKLKDFIKASLDPDLDYSPGYSTDGLSERAIIAYNRAISRLGLK